jgi:hypothetical protein
LAECDTFIERGYGKPLDALARKRPSDFHRSMSVRIGLDDRHDLAVRGEVSLDARKVMGKGREIDAGVGG